jgi:hypothetical protein
MGERGGGSEVGGGGLVAPGGGLTGEERASGLTRGDEG